MGASIAEGFQGQRSKVEVTAKPNALFPLRDITRLTPVRPLSLRRRHTDRWCGVEADYCSFNVDETWDVEMSIVRIYVVPKYEHDSTSGPRGIQRRSEKIGRYQNLYLLPLHFGLALSQTRNLQLRLYGVLFP